MSGKKRNPFSFVSFAIAVNFQYTYLRTWFNYWAPIQAALRMSMTQRKNFLRRYVTATINSISVINGFVSCYDRVLKTEKERQSSK
jgi:hypothetical protein